MMGSKEYMVIYTRQKTKKRPSWHDGTALLNLTNSKVTVYDDKGSLLDSLFVARGTQFLEIGLDLETDSLLVTIDAVLNADATVDAKKAARPDSGQNDALKLGKGSTKKFLGPARYTPYPRKSLMKKDVSTKGRNHNSTDDKRRSHCLQPIVMTLPPPGTRGRSRSAVIQLLESHISVAEQ